MVGQTKEQLAVIDRSIKAELRVGSRTCQCAVCGLFFTGIAPFDRHQTNGGTVCLSQNKMRGIGMTVNEHGVWSYGTPGKKDQAA